MDRRHVALIAVLAAALVIAAVSLGSLGVRLAQSPTAVPTAAPMSTPPAAFAVFARRQTAAEKAGAAFFGGLDSQDVTTVRIIGHLEGLVVFGWRSQGDICEGAYRSGVAPLPAAECAHARDFAEGGVSLRWPDSPDLGPFDLIWQPDGQVIVESAEPSSTAP